MLKKRLILCLLMKSNGIFFNSRNFTLQPVGELDWIRRYLNFTAIDELVLLNVDRNGKDRDAFTRNMRELNRYCFVPVSAGGGVHDLEGFSQLLDSGADKVTINTAAVETPAFISEAAKRYGSQCVVVSVDTKQYGDQHLVHIHDGQVKTELNVIDWARELEDRGAGEIFLTSIDRDGSSTGYDIDLVRSVADAVNIPVIASGGVGEFEHLVEGIRDANASAVSAANIFHYIGEGLTQARQHILGRGLDFPMWNFQL